MEKIISFFASLFKRKPAPNYFLISYQGQNNHRFFTGSGITMTLNCYFNEKQWREDKAMDGHTNLVILNIIKMSSSEYEAFSKT